MPKIILKSIKASKDEEFLPRKEAVSDIECAQFDERHQSEFQELATKLKSQSNSRKTATFGLVKQGRKMLKRSAKTNAPINVGDNVIVQIPNVDKAKSDLPNVIGVVLEVNEHGLHRIGTNNGILSQMYTR